jgi:hypothetical protein
MTRFCIQFGPDSASSVCFGEIAALIANAGLDAAVAMPRVTWEVLDDPFLLLELPCDVGLSVLSASVTAKAFFTLLAVSPTLDDAIVQLVAAPPSPDLFDVSAPPTKRHAVRH